MQINIIMKFSEFWIQLLEINISSKRVCGFTGWMISLFICLWCTLQISATNSRYVYLCSTSLLGVEAVNFYISTNQQAIKIKNINKFIIMDIKLKYSKIIPFPFMHVHFSPNCIFRTSKIQEYYPRQHIITKWYMLNNN